MPRGVGNCDRGALRGAEQGEAFKAKGINHALKIALKSRKGNFGHIPVGQSDAPAVIPNEARAASKRMQKWRGYRTLPVVFNMAEPMGGSDEDWTHADSSNREIDAILG